MTFPEGALMVGWTCARGMPSRACRRGRYRRAARGRRRGGPTRAAGRRPNSGAPHVADEGAGGRGEVLAAGQAAALRLIGVALRRRSTASSQDRAGGALEGVGVAGLEEVGPGRRWALGKQTKVVGVAEVEPARCPSGTGVLQGVARRLAGDQDALVADDARAAGGALGGPRAALAQPDARGPARRIGAEADRLLVARVDQPGSDCSVVQSSPAWAGSGASGTQAVVCHVAAVVAGGDALLAFGDSSATRGRRSCSVLAVLPKPATQPPDRAA